MAALITILASLALLDLVLVVILIVDSIHKNRDK